MATIPPSEITRRVESLRQWMRQRGLSAFVIPSTDPHASEYVPDHWLTRQWISGFDGSAGTAVVTLTAAALWTDSRYFLAAEQQLADTPFSLMKDGLPETPSVADWLAANTEPGARIGVDLWVFSVAEYRHLADAICPHNRLLTGADDPAATLWTDRPALPADPIRVQPLEYAGQIIKVSAYDKPSNLGVTITKRGNAEVLAGQTMRYDLTVANTSNVPLENFYWHDKIPYDVARATTLTTGTYSARLNYRILYKTNYQTTYQVLASNLLTSNNYSFALNAIPMQAGEVVTDIYFDFGKVPVGFQSVAGPTLSVIVNGNTVNGYQLVNRADVGGQYQGTWQTAQASWVTIVRKYTTTPDLPKTGY